MAAAPLDRRPGAEPGCRRLLVRPLPGPGPTSASARHDTPDGRAEVGWRIDGDRFELRVVVPPNTDAEVWVPGSAEAIVAGSGAHTLVAPANVVDVAERST
jgi:alpha-L-rhamnosidase